MAPRSILIVFLPLLAAIVAGLGGRWIGKTAAKVDHHRRAVHRRGAELADLLPLSSPATRSRRSCRCSTGSTRAALDVDWALRVDALTAVMLVVVTTVSSLVHLYSWGYMEEDPGQPRFFAYLSLFSFAMLMLVTADNLVQMFFGWEGVGLASYLLIGFWYHKPSRQRRGDQGVRRQPRRRFRLHARHLRHLPGVRHRLDPGDPRRRAGMAGSTIGFAGMRVDTMTLLCLLLFVGAMGKSAQLGLHTWLPDAMEGPTPVSALIHAATMVTAGVFMVCRLSPMFEAAPTAHARRHLCRRGDLLLRRDRRHAPRTTSSG